MQEISDSDGECTWTIVLFSFIFFFQPGKLLNDNNRAAADLVDDTPEFCCPRLDTFGCLMHC